MTKRGHLKYVSTHVDRHGKTRARFRRKGYPDYYFKAVMWTPAFMQEYQACLDGAPAPIAEGESRAAPGSFDALISLYYRTPDWLSPSDATRANRRRVIEHFRTEHGHRLVADLEPVNISALLGKRAETPTAANMLRKQLLRLMDYAVTLRIRTDNPVRVTKPYKIKSNGFHTWNEDEIAAFEARHPLGTKARLALALMLWTGQRRGDAIRMGRQHVAKGRLRFRQQKTDTALSLPILPPLADAIASMPADNMTFLVTSYGKPFTPAGFGNWFRDRCDEALLPQCSAHGLRKAASRRLAEAGCSNQLIKAWTGHKGDSEVAHYTREADQVLLSDQTGARLMRSELSTPDTGLDKPAANPLRKGS